MEQRSSSSSPSVSWRFFSSCSTCSCQHRSLFSASSASATACSRRSTAARARSAASTASLRNTCNSSFSSGCRRTVPLSSEAPLRSSNRALEVTSTTQVFTLALTSTHIAREANSRLLMVSCMCSAAGLAHTSNTVLQFPPMDPSSSRVSLLSRRGTCCFFSANALTTLPRASKLLLIALASRRCTPSTPLFFTRSDPARSTTLSRACVHCTRRALPPLSGVGRRGLFVSRTWKTAWLRLEALFILVSAYTMLDRALVKASNICSGC
mmetsp:Transcript_83135/g.151998  ORF Transcript_83135/g.151998 Transcript_83135/m.151998 type:complete len:267 (+) Transcript_83135:1389-2189(+)